MSSVASNKRNFMQATKKSLFLIPLLLLTFIISPLNTLKAETVAEAKDYALLISKPRHVKGVLNMLEKMRKDKTMIQYKHARVVLYGDAIHEVKKGSELTAMIELAKKNDVTIAVCNQAMKRLEVSASDLLPTVEVVE